MARNRLLVALVACYGAVLARGRPAGLDGSFDPRDPRARQAELAIETGRFDEALPLTLSLGESHAYDPEVRYWLGEIYQGLGRTADEIEAWREYVRVSPTPEEVCPVLPLAYVRAGDAASAQREFEFCVERAPDDPEQLISLAAEHARQGHIEQALSVYKRAAALDPQDPRILRRIAELGRGGPEEPLCAASVLPWLGRGSPCSAR